MKKAVLRAQIEALRKEVEREREKTTDAQADMRKLTREVEQMREHWRPVPIMHEWQPKDPQCALCDEPRAAARHQVDTP